MALIPDLILEGILPSDHNALDFKNKFSSLDESYLEICFVIRERSSFVQKCSFQIKGTREGLFCATVISLLHFVLFHLPS